PPTTRASTCATRRGRATQRPRAAPTGSYRRDCGTAARRRQAGRARYARPSPPRPVARRPPTPRADPSTCVLLLPWIRSGNRQLDRRAWRLGEQMDVYLPPDASGPERVAVDVTQHGVPVGGVDHDEAPGRGGPVRAAQ